MPPTPINITLPSLQSLLIFIGYSGQPLGSGTAFVYSGTTRSYLITNRHNVTGRNQDTNLLMNSLAVEPNELGIVHNLERIGTWNTFVEPLYAADGTRLWIEHPVSGHASMSLRCR